GLVASLSKPGGNATGVTFLSAEPHGKRLEILKAVVSGIRRVGEVFNPDSATEAKSFLDHEASARAINMEAQRVEIRLQSDIERCTARPSWTPRWLLSRATVTTPSLPSPT